MQAGMFTKCLSQKGMQLLFYLCALKDVSTCKMNYIYAVQTIEVWLTILIKTFLTFSMNAV